MKSILNFFRNLFSKTEKPKGKECDHLYYPVIDGDTPLGQRCVLCQQFNSVEDMPWYKANLEYQEAVRKAFAQRFK